MSSIIVEEWRDLWSFKVDFVFASLAWVFSSGNLLYLTQDIQAHGGVAFFVAYVASTLAFCLPIIIMELAVGQLTGRGPIQALFNICPLFKGVGVAQIIYCLLILSCLTVYLGYFMLHVFYMFWHIAGPLPWLSCENMWNKQNCVSNTTVYLLETEDSFQHSSINEFAEFLVRPGEDIEDHGELQWRLIAAQAAVWFLVFFAILAGVRWLGKVFYFTFLVPLVLLIALIIRLLTMHLKSETLVAVFEPDWSMLLETKTWQLAFSRSFYGLGIGIGAYITLGSYNKRNNNLVGDSFLIVFVHLLATTLGVIFAIMLVGFFDDHFSVPSENSFILQSVLDGYGFNFFYRILAVFQLFPVPKLWTGIFLFIVIFLMLNLFYVMSLSLLACLEDALGEKASRCLPRLGLAFLVCCLGFALSLGYSLQSGKFAVQLVQHFLDILTPWVIVTFEVVAVAWFYCAHLLGRDIRQMVSNTCAWISGFFFSELLYIVAAAPIFVLVVKLSEPDIHSPLASEVRKADWAEPVGWLIAVLPILAIPVFMIYIVVKTCLHGPGLNHWQRFKYTVISPLRYEVVKPMTGAYSTSSPGYILLPQAPLAEPENDVYMERVVKVSNI